MNPLMQVGTSDAHEFDNLRDYCRSLEEKVALLQTRLD